MRPLPSLLVPCFLALTAAAQDSSHEFLAPFKREINNQITSKKSLIGNSLGAQIDSDTPLSQLYPAVNHVNDSRLRECYNPTVGDEEHNIFENSLFDNIQSFYRLFPENYDFERLAEKIQNLIKSFYEIGEHTTRCLLNSTSYQLGVTQLADFSDEEYRTLLGSPRTEYGDKLIRTGYKERPPPQEDEPEPYKQNKVYRKDKSYRNGGGGYGGYGGGGGNNNGGRRARPKRQAAEGGSQVEVDAKCFPKNKSVLPNRFDWRSKGVVTPVKYQGSCGSCWAFASLAVLESALLIKGKTTNKKLDLSEQQLIACAKKMGCNGGTSVDAFNFILSNNGVTDENSLAYDYKKTPLRCNKKKKKKAKIRDYCLRGVYANRNGKPEHLSDKEIMLAIREFGPVYATMNADHVAVVKHLKTGVYTNAKCPKVTNHAVVIVGWDKRSWIIKNSWGKKWGDNGFFRMKRGENLCGLNTYITYPLV